VVPPLAPLRPWVVGGGYVPFWNVIGRELLGEGKAMEAEQAALEELREKSRAPEAPTSMPVRSIPKRAAGPVFPPYRPERRVEKPKHGIEPPEALDHYFGKLTLADLGVKGAIARAGHWGDSVLSVDGITSGIRNRLQSRFGDAGHGFHLMDRYNPSYRQKGIEFHPGGGWNACLVVQECQKKDNRYGYGGLVVHSGGGGAAIWSTPEEGFGQAVSLFELWYANKERGGKVEIAVDDGDPIVVDTRGPELEDGWHPVRVPSGAHTFKVKVAGGGEVRLYGVVLENDGPGVVWDGMVLVGGSTRGLRTQDEEHIKSQIRHRDVDVIVFMFGGNDMARNYVDLVDSMDLYHQEYGEVLHNFRAGKPEMSCLVMSTTDHGERGPGGDILSRKFAHDLAKAQRKIAHEGGCGFFDTFEATGGVGMAARWFRASPPLLSPDLGHPTGAGREVIAALLSDALLYGYEQYRQRMEGKPLPELARKQKGGGR
jgi:lysophospholipase L1-like esterase